MLLGKVILKILTDNQAVIDTTFSIMTYFVPFYFLLSVIEVYTGILMGIGDMFVPSVIQAIGIYLLRIVWVYTISVWKHTLFILALSYLVFWFVTDIAIIIYYVKCSKKVLNIPSEIQR